MDKQNSPLARLMSVITPVYNDEVYIRRAAKSVAEQTVPVYEHIIINDGSTDGTARVLEELKETYPNVHLITQKRKGAAIARNQGIDHAKGKYIAFLDSDDLWHKRKVENQVRFMEEEGCNFSYGDYNEVDHQDLHLKKTYHFPESVEHKHLLRGCPIGCLTAAYNQEALGKHYLPLERSGQDWGLWLSLTGLGERAQKYPGIEASYANGRRSLSHHKLRKAASIYRIYVNYEKLSPLGALFRTSEHACMALIKKAGLIYAKNGKEKKENADGAGHGGDRRGSS